MKSGMCVYACATLFAVFWNEIFYLLNIENPQPIVFFTFLFAAILFCSISHTVVHEWRIHNKNKMGYFCVQILFSSLIF